MGITKCGINGFGRIGRLVARIMVKDPETKLLHINAGSATPDYMAYQFKFDSIHGRFDGAVLVDGDDLILDGQRVVVRAWEIPECKSYDPCVRSKF